MALDLHTKVNFKSILEVELTREFVFLKVSYTVKRGRKVYTLWALPEDLRDCGVFPLCYTKDGKVLTMDNKTIYEGSVYNCKKLVKIANKRYYTAR